MANDGFTDTQRDQLIQIVEQVVDTKVSPRFTAIEQHLTDVEQRLTGFDQSFASIEQRFTVIDKTLETMDKKIDALAEKDQEDSDALLSTVVDHGRRIKKLEGFHKTKLAHP